MPVSQVFVAPGNGGTAQGLDKVSNVSIAVDDFSKLIGFAKKMKVNFVVPGQSYLRAFFPCFSMIRERTKLHLRSRSCSKIPF